MINTFILAALLILGWSQAQDSHATEQVAEPEVIYDSLVSLPLDPESFRGMLRHPSLFEEIPEAIIISIVCYTDGHGELRVLAGWGDFVRTLTDDGKFELNQFMVNLGTYACEQALEAHNADNIIREGEPVWYL
jgi:hypothetical protein